MAQITLNSTGVASNGALVLQSNGTTTAVTINASQGVEFNAGTAALPAITTTGDTNTGIFFPAADTIAFTEGGAEAMRIDSSGTLILNQGQIQFPATQVASANANTLDDYEEGTWTPSLGGNTTYSQNAGSYTKIGNLVYIFFYMNVTAIGTGSTTVVSGLPFTVGTTVNRNKSGSMGFFDSIATSVVTLFPQPIPSSTTINFVGLSSAQASVINPVTMFQNTTQVNVSAVYQV